MDMRLSVGREVVHRVDGHDNCHVALVDLIEALPGLLSQRTGGNAEVTLSVYIRPEDFDTDCGFCLEDDQTRVLAELRCALNVVFLADNHGPVR
ncbi:MAG: hypothetical protein ABMA25_10445 [Ilumatobacteraceae bacterium]